MSRFPKLTETFVLYEILALQALGVAVGVYPLLREKQAVAHPEVDALVRRAHFLPFLSFRILRAHLHFIRRTPAAYFRLWLEVLRKTWGSPNFFIGALGIFPKAVRFAYDMRTDGIDHVHAHFATHPAVAALVVHRLTGIPFSFTAHGSDLHVDRRMLDTKVEAAAFAVAVSEYNRQVIVDTCGEAVRPKVHVVHCGVDTGFFAPVSRKRSGPFEMVCVASFEEVKGHRYLVDACRILNARGLDFRCHLVGEGPLRGEIEAQIQGAGLVDRCVVHGGQPRGTVVDLLQRADAAVLASHPTSQGKREGIPVFLMEAMACGLPVVATAISGIPELVEAGRTGLLVAPRDAEALAEALHDLSLDEELRERLGNAGRERVQEAFDQRANVNLLKQLFRSYQRSPSLAAPLRARRFTLRQRIDEEKPGDASAAWDVNRGKEYIMRSARVITVWLLSFLLTGCSADDSVDRNVQREIAATYGYRAHEVTVRRRGQIEVHIAETTRRNQPAVDRQQRALEIARTARTSLPAVTGSDTIAVKFERRTRSDLRTSSRISSYTFAASALSLE